MRTTLCAAVVSLGLLLAPGAKPLSAHHAFSSEFDAKRPVKFEGTVTKMAWINPHAWIYMDVMKSDGSPSGWREARVVSSRSNRVTDGSPWRAPRGGA